MINEAEADQVRSIYTRHLKLGSVHALCAELKRQGVRSKAWTAATGRRMGGAVFSRGALYHLLRSPLYIGQIPHKDQIHEGRHPAIVQRQLFDQVQGKLDRQKVRGRKTASKPPHSPLKGIIFDAEGQPMSPTFAMGKKKRLYRYYTSSSLQHGGGNPTTASSAASPPTPWRPSCSRRCAGSQQGRISVGIRSPRCS